MYSIVDPFFEGWLSSWKIKGDKICRL